jgi:hypothetical protein
MFSTGMRAIQISVDGPFMVGICQVRKKFAGKAQGRAPEAIFRVECGWRGR